MDGRTLLLAGEVPERELQGAHGAVEVDAGPLVGETKQGVGAEATRARGLLAEEGLRQGADHFLDGALATGQSVGLAPGLELCIRFELDEEEGLDRAAPSGLSVGPSR